LAQSTRTDFPTNLDREVVDGGLREGRPETPLGPGMLYVAILVMLLPLGVGLVLGIRMFAFP